MKYLKNIQSVRIQSTPSSQLYLQIICRKLISGQPVLEFRRSFPKQTKRLSQNYFMRLWTQQNNIVRKNTKTANKIPNWQKRPLIVTTQTRKMPLP